MRLNEEVNQRKENKCIKDLVCVLSSTFTPKCLTVDSVSLGQLWIRTLLKGTNQEHEDRKFPGTHTVTAHMHTLFINFLLTGFSFAITV